MLWQPLVTLWQHLAEAGAAALLVSMLGKCSSALHLVTGKAWLLWKTLVTLRQQLSEAGAGALLVSMLRECPPVKQCVPFLVRTPGRREVPLNH